MAGGERPVYTLFAGPNGAGKSTLVAGLQTVGFDTGPFVNPDVIAKELSERGETGNLDLKAGRQTLRQTAEHIKNGVSFSRESTLSGREILKSMQEAKNAGFQVNLIYVGVKDRQLSGERVAERAEGGGHDIPQEALDRRYDKSLANVAAATKIADRTIFFDNSSVDKPHIVVGEAENGRLIKVASPEPEWFTQATRGLDRENTPSIDHPPTPLSRGQAAQQIGAAQKAVADIKDPTRKAVAQHQVDAMRSAAGLGQNHQKGRSIARPGRSGDQEQEQ